MRTSWFDEKAGFDAIEERASKLEKCTSAQAGGEGTGPPRRAAGTAHGAQAAGQESLESRSCHAHELVRRESGIRRDSGAREQTGIVHERPGGRRGLAQRAGRAGAAADDGDEVARGRAE